MFGKRVLMILFMVLIFTVLFSRDDISAQKNEDMKIYVNLWSGHLMLMKNEIVIESFSIAHGTENTPTPIGTFNIIEKSKGWGGGFGTRWLGMNVPWGKYGIHGTNKPSLIGKNVSSGCIRMFNDDVEKLYEMVPIGTVVHIDGPITGTGKGELKNLSLGSKGNLVQLVQQRLKAIGHYSGEINGIYDSKTEQGMKKFQKENTLPITGGVTYREYKALGLME
ncbi:L,D-transpeptidase family protein [Bacillus taeanensis]|uniref:L,D-TPase catalytic domain-containing protein n=1 Tax=Bacillus taeanensis TaxID=273032 RepID=A0A366XU17_9BACI|nr:L,D-transpeptidase family protein [Bacillus taeanensis]RBW69632.1 hypothetical protein DS031_10425 [Bacillus taeanensis]